MKRAEGDRYAHDEDCLTYLDRELLIVICEDAEGKATAELITTVAGRASGGGPAKGRTARRGGGS